MDEPIQLFYSYSHKDEELRNTLETHLSGLKRQGVTVDWHDRRILASQNWEAEIDSHIDNADIILLLISPDFIASDYCYGRELARALERHEANEAKVVPIILRPVDLTGAPFAEFQALPQDAKPITTWANQDEAWLDVSKGVRRLVNSLISSKVSTATTPGPVHVQDHLLGELARLAAVYERPSTIGGASTGFHSLDQAIDGIHKTDIVLICGRPSVGKSDLVLHIASQMTSDTSLPVVFFSMRLPTEQITRRLLAAKSNVSVPRLVRGLLTPEDWSRLVLAAGPLSEAPIFIDTSTGYTDMELTRRIETVYHANKLGLVVVDGVEHLTSVQSHNTKRGEVGAVVKALRKISIDYEVPLVLTATTVRPTEFRVNRRPMIIDLEDWEALASDAANVVLILYQCEDWWIDGPNKGVAEINVEKNAYGHTGTVRLRYRSHLCRFENLEEEEQQ
jgi:replicative DNA helicase